MALVDFVCLCVWFSFFFKRERESTVFQNRCKSTLTPSWGHQGNLHKRKARRTHVAGCLNLWTVSKVGKAALCRSLQAQTGCPPRHKLGLWRSGCWDEKEKAKITKRQTKLLLHVSPDGPFRWHPRKGRPSASVGCGQWGPGEGNSVNKDDRPSALAPNSVSTKELYIHQLVYSHHFRSRCSGYPHVQARRWAQRLLAVTDLLVRRTEPESAYWGLAAVVTPNNWATWPFETERHLHSAGWEIEEFFNLSLI